MRKHNFIIVLIAGFFFSASAVYAAPWFTYQRSLLPIDATENIGTTTAPWDKGFFNTVCLSGDCRTSWTAGSSAAIATSTSEAKGDLAYWTSTSATPATLGKVSTTTLTASSPLSLSNTVAKIGGSDSVLTLDTSGTWSGNAGTATALAANGTNCSSGNYPLGVDASGNAEGCTAAAAGSAFPFTPTANYNSTSTPIGFLQGLFATASSTFSSALRLTSLSDGGLGVNAGLVYSGATTTAGTGLTYSGNAFNVNTSQNIATLSNLTSNGFVKTSGSNGTLSVDTSTFLSSYDAWTHPVAGVSATTSNMRLYGSYASTTDLSAHRAWFGSTATSSFSAAGVLTLATDLAVSEGGTGVSTLTGLALGNGASAFSAYAGSSCTNQFIRSLNGSGVATCATVANTDLANSSINLSYNGLSGSNSVSLGGTLTLTGKVSTSSVPTVGHLAYWTGAGTPSTLGTVATTSVGCSGFITCTGFYGLGAASTITTTGQLSIASGGTNNSTFPSNSILYYDGTKIAATSSNPLYFSSFIATSTTNNSGIGTTTPWALLGIHAGAQTFPYFNVGSSTASLFTINQYGGIELSADQPATSTAIVLDWSKTKPQVEYQIGTSATTITLINATTSQFWGSRKIVWVCNPGTTAGAITWRGVEWIGTAPTQTTTANQCDVYSFNITRATSTSAYKVAGAGSTGFQ